MELHEPQAEVHTEAHDQLDTVILVGMPGAGKTTIGTMLADELGTRFVDTDVLLEEKEGMRCDTLFSQWGEERFRQEEAAVIEQAITQPGVVALGGGAVVTPSVRDLLRGRAVVWLDVNVDEGIDRSAGGTPRPILHCDDPRARYAELYAQRAPLYGEVTRWRIPTDHRDPHTVVADVRAVVCPTSTR